MCVYICVTCNNFNFSELLETFLGKSFKKSNRTTSSITFFMAYIKTKGVNKMINIAKGVGISIGFTLTFLLIFSIILTYTNTSEQWTSPVIIVLTGISILIGSSIGNTKLKKNGILNGGIIGGIYFIIMYLISSTIKMDFSINMQTIIIILVGIGLGILGGIIGVNKK